MNYQCKYCSFPFSRKDNWITHESKRGKSCVIYEKLIRDKVIETMKSTEKLIRDDCEKQTQLRVREAILAERELLEKENQLQVREAVLAERERLLRLVEAKLISMKLSN